MYAMTAIQRAAQSGRHLGSTSPITNRTGGIEYSMSTTADMTSRNTVDPRVEWSEDDHPLAARPEPNGSGELVLETGRVAAERPVLAGYGDVLCI